LAEFILDAASLIEEAYHYSVRGKNEMSFGTFSMLSDELYAATLIVGRLVTFEKPKEGGFLVKAATSEWTKWLDDCDLSYKHGDGRNVAEMSSQRVRLNAFKHRKSSEAGTRLTGDRAHVHTIRIGQDKTAGDTPINNQPQLPLWRTMCSASNA